MTGEKQELIRRRLPIGKLYLSRYQTNLSVPVFFGSWNLVLGPREKISLFSLPTTMALPVTVILPFLRMTSFD